MLDVSVLMPCYNAAQTLEETLQSLADQTHPSFEVVAVDDGSEDETRAILQSWEKKDSRFKCLALSHTGIIPALNSGLAASQGRYIARMDADDLALPERLSLQAQYLDENPETALVSCIVKGFPEQDVRTGFRIYIDWLNSLLIDEDIRREMFIESPLAHPSVMYRRELVLSLGGYKEAGWAEDYDLWLRMALSGARFAKLPQVLLAWREHPRRLTRTDSRYSLENFIRAKAHYLMQGPLKGKDSVIIWGAGMSGRRLSKHLLRLGTPIKAFLDVDPAKVGKTRHGIEIFPIEALTDIWEQAKNPVLLAAVASRGKRQLIREHLHKLELVEGHDWWAVA